MESRRSRLEHLPELGSPARRTGAPHCASSVGWKYNFALERLTTATTVPRGRARGFVHRGSGRAGGLGFLSGRDQTLIIPD